MRFAPLALLALCTIACEAGDPDRDTFDISQDPSTALDATSPPISSATEGAGDAGDDGGRRNSAIPVGGYNNNKPNPGGTQPSFDASTPSQGGPAGDAAVAGSITDGAALSPFACQRNTDCVIKDVGNCCGYYPRCANVGAVFPAPVCTGGQAGICGFPAIDSCECRQNQCVSLQGGLAL